MPRAASLSRRERLGLEAIRAGFQRARLAVDKVRRGREHGVVDDEGAGLSISLPVVRAFTKEAALSRLDAVDKARGRARYVGDLVLPGMVHVAVARSTMPHARIVRVDSTSAAAAPGVLAVFSGEDLSDKLYGRALVDCPVLARGKVRFVGERVVAVVAESRRAAEEAAALVEVEYDPLPAVTDMRQALTPDAPVVHERHWEYEGALASPEDPANQVYRGIEGSLEALEEALVASAHALDVTYTSQSVHQGYLEPQACVADFQSPERVRVWLTNKAPYRIREMIGHCLDIDPAAIELEPTSLGGDFGGKGSAQDSPLCVALSRALGRPVKMVLRYSEDLIATNPRARSEIRVRLGCDEEGGLTAVGVEALLDAGAYGGFTPATAGPRGAVTIPSYRIPVFYSDMRRVYTNTVPRGNMRAPGAPQGIFAFESAMDELAAEVGLHPAELRRRNLLRVGDSDSSRQRWTEHRGAETLDAAYGAFEPIEPPRGWLHGTGLAVYSRPTPSRASTSLRVLPLDDGCVRVETALVETGTGSHSALRQMVSDQLDVPLGKVEVVGVSTSDLPRDQGAGGSRVTVGLAAIVEVAGKAWHNRLVDEPVLVEIDDVVGPPVGSYVALLAQVAVDPETGQLDVLELLSAVDVATIVNPRAHQMQIDGGATMGFGFACLEDLLEAEGQIWAADLGELKLPTARDVPRLRTVHVPGGIGMGMANVKSIGESTTPPVAAAVANAVHAATGCRIRDLPITAEKIHAALRGQGA